MEANSWPGQGKTFSSLRIWHCPVKPFTFCNEWGEARRVNSCRNFSCIKLKYFQLYIVGEMLFFLLLRNYLHVRARWVEALWFILFKSSVFIEFYIWSLFLDVILFCLALIKEEKKCPHYFSFMLFLYGCVSLLWGCYFVWLIHCNSFRYSIRKVSFYFWFWIFICECLFVTVNSYGVHVPTVCIWV